MGEAVDREAVRRWPPRSGLVCLRHRDDDPGSNDTYPTPPPPLYKPAAEAPLARRVGYGRLIAWLALVLVLAGLSFGVEALVDDRANQTVTGLHRPTAQDPFYGATDEQRSTTWVYGEYTPRDDTFYHYAFAVFGIGFYVIVLGLVLLIARRLPRTETFALYRPTWWPRLVGLILGLFLATGLLDWLGSNLFDSAEPDQGIPLFWDGSRAAQFALSFAVVAIVAPVVEELTFRGLGFSLLSRFGPRTALCATSILFGLAHGFLFALPLFIAFGFAVGWLRLRTGSVYPGIVLHGLINAVAVLAAVSLGA
jgi:membrane protease YdiL (CAAX protease family)